MAFKDEYEGWISRYYSAPGIPQINEGIMWEDLNCHSLQGVSWRIAPYTNYTVLILCTFKHKSSLYRQTFIFKAQGGQALNSFPTYFSDNIWLTIRNKCHNVRRRDNFETLQHKAGRCTVKYKEEINLSLCWIN